MNNPGQDEERGEGSRFWFALDLPEVAAADAAPRPERPIVGVRSHRRRILVVDDKADNRRPSSRASGSDTKLKPTTLESR